MAEEKVRPMYRPLNEARRGFRVVRLLLPENPHNQSDGRLKAELRVLSLNDEPEYTALSYCWGREDAVHTLYLKGQPFAIRPNLSEYLSVRRQEAKSEASLIFIDAICIDQEDLSERSYQLRLMGDIYHSASDVIAWLGSAPIDGETAYACALDELLTPNDLEVDNPILAEL